MTGKNAGLIQRTTYSLHTDSLIVSNAVSISIRVASPIVRIIYLFCYFDLGFTIMSSVPVSDKVQCQLNKTPFGDSGSELYFIVCCYISHIIVTNSSLSG